MSDDLTIAKPRMPHCCNDDQRSSQTTANQIKTFFSSGLQANKYGHLALALPGSQYPCGSQAIPCHIRLSTPVAARCILAAHVAVSISAVRTTKIRGVNQESDIPELAAGFAGSVLPGSRELSCRFTAEQAQAILLPVCLQLEYQQLFWKTPWIVVNRSSGSVVYPPFFCQYRQRNWQ
ncbi:hypothetical protein [Propionivibrio sp.]|uniref:hypothetical protein n=1 Tax=Propionivibrio sp. TaxID=2212460 RepID=UPI003BF02EE3